MIADRVDVVAGRRMAVAAAVLAHVALLAGFWLREVWHVAELTSGQGPLLVSLRGAAHAPGSLGASAGERSTTPVAPRPRTRRRVIQQPTQRPTPSRELAAQDPEIVTGGEPAADGLVGASEGAGVGLSEGLGSGASGGGSREPPAMDETLRRSLIRGYLDQILRPKIAERFSYPHEAARRNLEGIVLLRITISGTGSLLGTRIVGPCPAVLLCDAAVDVVRRASPFAPPPRELESPVEIEIPLVYRLD